MSSSIGQPDRPTPTAVPERVWAVEPHGNCGWSATLMPVFYTEVGDTKPLGAVAHPYVPEQRALDAERELSNMAYEYNMISSQSAQEIADLRAERDALRDGLNALLQAARHGYDEQAFCPLYGWRQLTEEELEAARAILDREGA